MDSRTKQDFTRRITQSNRSELVVVLYDICFSYLDEAEKNLKEKDFDVYKEAVRKADAVIGELQAALNFQYELSPQLYPLYSYCRRELMRSMYQQSGDGIAHAKRVLSGLYQAFCEVAKQVQDTVTGAVESMTGMGAPVVNVHVSGVAFDK